jgi:hypothetical protein
MKRTLLLLCLYVFILPIILGVVFPGGAGHEGALLIIGPIFVTFLSAVFSFLSVLISKKRFEKHFDQLILIVSLLISSYLIYYLLFSDDYLAFRRSFYISNAICIAFVFLVSIYRRRRGNKEG